jgi:Ca2+-binding EF-hand superfamily protein
MNAIFDKIKEQWTTIKKSFTDLNKDNKGTIDTEELRAYFNKWGIHMTEETF